MRILAIALLVSVVLALPLTATTLVVNPADTGSLYTCNGCDPSPDRIYMTVGGYVVGEADFSTATFGGGVTKALFSVNPYALPLFGPQLEVYGYASQSSTISISDLNSPTYLGTWTLPANLGYGDDAYFDVSAFVQSVKTPYLDIILKSNGSDQFSSLQHNYGHASQLTLTIPEPAGFTLAFAGLATLVLRRRVTK